MHPAGFKPAIPASVRPHTHTLRLRGHWDRQVCVLRRTEFLTLWLTEACLCGTAAFKNCASYI
jgi:hypothetical protein